MGYSWVRWRTTNYWRSVFARCSPTRPMSPRRRYSAASPFSCEGICTLDEMVRDHDHEVSTHALELRIDRTYLQVLQRSRSMTTDAAAPGQYAEVNGINLYYETHGAGQPLILLHGGLGSGETFGPVLPLLAERHQVITPDLQGHGRTADIDRPIDVRLMADDIAALIDHLGLDRPDVAG